MLSQLLLAKRLFTEAGTYAQRKDLISCGIAISMLQDASELYIWALIKERNLQVKENAGFTANITTIQNEKIPLPNQAKLLELNKVRINFKHYGVLPAPEDAKKFQIYVEDFLRLAMLEHFGVNFDDLSLVDLVADPKIREQFRSAEARLKEGNTSGAAEDLAKAKTLIFARLQKYIPKVNLDGYDRSIGLLRERPFSALGEYLDVLRESCLVAMFNLPINEYSYVRNILPSASRPALSGEWRVHHTRGPYNEPEIQRALSCLVNLCTRLEGIE